jgi:methionyl-tRNA formyltransferase
MRILFCGTPEFAVPTLRRLHAEGFDITAVVTQPDRPKGRGLAPTGSPVKRAAQELGLRVEQPEKLRGEAGRHLLEKYKPEAVVIVGYGQIIPAELLVLPKHGWINLHASLLPRYRGAAPVQWALVRGETVTGVTTMRIDSGLDTGPILLQAEEAIGEEDTAVTLGARLAERGAGLMVETLRGLESGSLAPRPQDNTKASKAPLLKKEDGRVDWSRAARDIFNRVRGLVPWPGAFTRFRGKNLHLWWAKAVEAPEGVVQPPAPGTLLVEKHALFVACGENTWLRLEEVQPADRKRMRAEDFVNGLHVSSGERFGDL